MTTSVHVQRIYIDGQLEKTTKPQPIEVLRKWLVERKGR